MGRCNIIIPSNHSAVILRILFTILIIILFQNNSFSQDKNNITLPDYISLAYSPFYEDWHLFSFSYHLSRPSNKEFQFLLGSSPAYNNQYYRLETSINWYLSKTNRSNPFRIFPTTGIALLYKRRMQVNNGYTRRTEGFIMTGFNTDLKITDALNIYGKAELGFGYYHEPNVTPDIYHNAFNIFYLLGLKFNL